MLSRPESFVWDSPEGPTAIDIQIMVCAHDASQDGLRIRVTVLGFEFDEIDFSCYTTQGTKFRMLYN